MPLLVSLPAELVLKILSLLPLCSKLLFGQVSRHCHSLAAATVTAISFGIFPNRISSCISSIHSSSTLLPSIPADHIVTLAMPRALTKTRKQMFSFQTMLSLQVIERYASTLQSLDLRICNMQSAKELAKAKGLRNLALRMDHPFIRHQDIDKSYWNQVEGSTLWNELGGVWDRLETLTLERAGITEWQLARILSTNPGLKELSLKKCLNLGRRFWKYLMQLPTKDSLRRLRFTCTDNHEVNETILPYISGLHNLEFLSLQQCRYLDNAVVLRANEEIWHIPGLVLPVLSETPDARDLEVDPAYLIDGRSNEPDQLVAESLPYFV